MLKVKVFGVEWDEDGSDLDGEITIEIDDTLIENKDNKQELEELISDGLSDSTGFCHYGWESYEIIEDNTPVVFDGDKGLLSFLVLLEQ